MKAIADLSGSSTFAASSTVVWNLSPAATDYVELGRERRRKPPLS
jgi:hypothetical protein